MLQPVVTTDSSENRNFMAKNQKLGIGDISKLTGVKIETIRYYEKQNLLADPPRSEGGHRLYGVEHHKRLLFIRRSRQLGFSIEEIRELLDLVEGETYTCGEVKTLTVEHAKSIQGKIIDLKKMEAALLDYASKCSGDTVPDCPIIEALSEMPDQN